MELRPDMATTAFFALLIFPGLISIAVYRLIMPARAMDWSAAVVQGLFYSTLNFVLLLPALYYLVFRYGVAEHPGRYIAAAYVGLLIAPAAWPFGMVALLRSDALTRRFQLPYPTAWDYFFDLGERAFVLVHLNSGALIGGYYGPRSYAGSFPSDGDLYLEVVYEVTVQGTFANPIDDSRGVLLRREQYSYVELFAVSR